MDNMQQNQEELFCKKCGTIGEYALFENGPHTEARCTACGAHIKFVSKPPSEIVAMKDTDPMPFGKHKGVALANVPASYLLWLSGENLSHRPLRKYLDENIDVIRKEAGR